VVGEKSYCYEATTNPGTYWLTNPMNPKGAAVVKPGYYKDLWAIGLHKGYEALVQVGKISVYRDSNRDTRSDETATVDVGIFGIDLHRSNPLIKSINVDKWSAGCQVVNKHESLDEILKLCKTSGLPKFSYILLKEFSTDIVV
jgi:hypothetical protein